MAPLVSAVHAPHLPVPMRCGRPADSFKIRESPPNDRHLTESPQESHPYPLEREVGRGAHSWPFQSLT
jgi:hypothetical protein